MAENSGYIAMWKPSLDIQEEERANWPRTPELSNKI